MKKLLRTIVPLLAALPLWSNQIVATFTGVNGAEAFGYYVGPYYGTLDQEPVVLNCVDFANDVSFGQQWTANLSHINTAADLVNTRYGNEAGALQLYQEAAWLTLQYSLNPSSAYADIHATIWRLFDSAGPMPSSSYWLDEAQANFGQASYANFFVVTNTGPVYPTGQIQEFVTQLDPSMPIYPADPANAAPVSTSEPELLGGVGLGLICLAEVLRRVRKRV
jgi:hypothetical protein